jgi:hypothetical protein
MRLAVLAVATVACGEQALPIPPECNGAIELCDRRFDEVVFPTTHNAMSSEADGFVNPNQYLGLRQQLLDGVRGMMLDTYEYKDGLALCHVFCQAGNTPLIDGLRTIRDFLHDHRGEVVTLILESHITADQTRRAFEDSGLIDYVHVHQAGAPWPTLRELIDADERLIALTESGGGEPSWYMDVWAHAWETNYHFESIGELSCAMNRGGAGNPLFILNHFLTNTFAVPAMAEAVNGALLGERAQQCRRDSGRLPNFIAVDFYSIGTLFDVARTLNGL